MSSQQGGTLALTTEMLTGAKSNQSVIALPAVKESWIEKNQMVTGLSRAQSEANYEAEKIIFSNKISESKALQECDRMTLYASWIMHSISGLSFTNDEAYVVPYKGKAQWMPGWKGRLKQLANRPNVDKVLEPQVVYDCDKSFSYQITDEGVVIPPFTPFFPRPEGSRPVAVFVSIKFVGGEKQTFLMTAEEVHTIRDQFSASYKQYQKSGGKWPNGSPMDPPLALSNEAQYFRKTLVKRVYNNTTQGKSGAEKVLDEKLIQAVKEVPEIEVLEDDLESKLNSAFEVQANGDKVDVDSGEVYEDPEYVNDAIGDPQPEEQPSGNTEEVDVVNSTFADLD